MSVRQNIKKWYNIIKLNKELLNGQSLLSHFIGYNHKEEYLFGQDRCFSFWLCNQRLPNSNERVHKPDCNSTVLKEISMQELVTLMATAISIIVNKCGEKVLVLGLTPSISS